jgi:hypothetical protein
MLASEGPMRSRKLVGLRASNCCSQMTKIRGYDTSFQFHRCIANWSCSFPVHPYHTQVTLLDASASV